LLYSCLYVHLSVCLFVCVPARICQTPHVQTSRNSLYISPVAVARSSDDDNAIRHVLPVLWMTSCFHMIGANRDKATSKLFTVIRQLAPWAMSALADCLADDDVLAISKHLAPALQELHCLKPNSITLSWSHSDRSEAAQRPAASWNLVYH